MDKIRSGQSFLYREGGLNSTVIDIRMKHEIYGDFLQKSLNKSLQRFPYMDSRFIEIDGDFYLDESPFPMYVTETNELRVLGSMSTGYHLVDVTYYGTSIRVAFHHALCDGRGIKPFVETLIYYYCSLRYDHNFNSTGIHLAEEGLLPGETAEPLRNSFFTVDEEKLPHVASEGYSLPECSETQGRYYRHEICIDKEGFVGYAKEHGATPGILLAALTSGGIRHIHPDADKPIVCSMAIDLRRELGMDNTHKNCVASLYLPFTDEIGEMDLDEQAVLYRGMMKEQRSPDAIRQLANKQIGLCGKLDQIPSLKGKQQALSFFNNHCVNTYVISYLGQIQLNDYAGYLDSIHMYNSGVRGLRVNMISAGDTITVDVMQDFESDAIATELTQALDNIGISYTDSPLASFETVKDQVYMTAGKLARDRYRTAS